MKARFYIDRQFGIPIWFDVEDGIITEFKENDLDLRNKLTDTYKGYPVTKFKKEFELRMKPAFYCVHPYELATLRAVAENIDNQIHWWYSQFAVTTSRRKSDEEIEKEIENLRDRLAEVEDKIKEETRILKEAHNFESQYKEAIYIW